MPSLARKEPPVHTFMLHQDTGRGPHKHFRAKSDRKIAAQLLTNDRITSGEEEVNSGRPDACH